MQLLQEKGALQERVLCLTTQAQLQQPFNFQLATPFQQQPIQPTLPKRSHQDR